MTDKEQRDAALTVVAAEVEKVMPGHYGAVRFNLHDGKVANVNIEESVRIRPEPTVRAGTHHDLKDRRTQHGG